MWKPVILALFLAITTYVNGLSASPTEPLLSSSDDAIRLGQSGVTKFRNESWKEAYDDFIAADAVMHSPVFGLYIARCLKKLGRWKEALEKYDSISSSSLSVDVPIPWLQAYETARTEREELKQELPSVRIRLLGSSISNAVFAIDDVRLPTSGNEATTFSDPGSHRITVLLDGETVETRTLELYPSPTVYELEFGPYVNKSSKVNLSERNVQTAGQMNDTARALKNHPVKIQAEQGDNLKSIGKVALGLGALGVLVGSGFGIYAWREHELIAEQCDDGSCPKRLNARIERGKILADVSTIALVNAAVSFSVAGVLFYVTPRISNSTGVRTAQNSLEFRLIGQF